MPTDNRIILAIFNTTSNFQYWVLKGNVCNKQPFDKVSLKVIYVDRIEVSDSHTREMLQGCCQMLLEVVKALVTNIWTTSKGVGKIGRFVPRVVIS
jgi:hypothetical protein